MKYSFLKENYLLLLSILILGIVYVYSISILPIFQWDESRLGVNAIEMLNSKHFITTTYEGYPDNWNTKPPFVIWLMGISLTLFGFTEFSLRLPSVIFSLMTIIFVIQIIKKLIKLNSWFQILYLIILSTCIGFSGYHVAITGDYDATLVFFFTVFTLSSFFAIEKFTLSNRQFDLYFFIAITAFTLGFFTKGIAIGLASPAILLYFLYSKKYKFLISNLYWYHFLSIVSSLGLIIGYYLVRDYQSPGYIEAVFNNELGGRYNVSAENHVASPFIYLQNILTGRFSIWVYLFFLFPIVFVKKITKEKLLGRLTFYNLSVISVFLLVISTAKTKLDWYDAPIYPLIALQVLINVSIFYEYFKSKKKKKLFINFLLIAISIFSIVQITMYYKALLQKNAWPHENSSVLLKEYVEKYKPTEVNIIIEDYQSHLELYKLFLKQQNIVLNKISYLYLPRFSQSVYITDNLALLESVAMFYDTHIIEKTDRGVYFKIRGINKLGVDSFLRMKSEEIKKDETWINDIKRKAEINNISVDKQIINDIIYVSENSDKAINNAVKDYIYENY